MSSSSLETLAALVPPPLHPTSAVGDFPAIEEELGTSLPEDWKGLIRRYGYGTFGEFFNLWSPFFVPCTMVSQAQQMLDAHRQRSATAPQSVPFPLYPESGGALPWGSTDNGDVVYWLTRGAPDSWPIAVWNSRSVAGCEVFPGGAVLFLVTWMEEGRVTGRFSAGAPRCFDPWLEREHLTFQLSGGSAPFSRRLDALVRALGPVEIRGSLGDEGEERRQVHFVSRSGAWRFTYDTLYGHNIRAAVPPGDVEAVRQMAQQAALAMGCTVR